MKYQCDCSCKMMEMGESRVNDKRLFAAVFRRIRMDMGQLTNTIDGSGFSNLSIDQILI